MIKVYCDVIGTGRKVEMFDPNTSIRACIEACGFNAGRGMWTVNGATVNNIDVTFASLGKTDGDVYLSNLAKMDNNA